MTKSTNAVPYNEVQGTCPGGVVAYSNGNDLHFSADRNFDEGLFTGFKWQCVEFARRWLLEKKGLILPDIPWAAHIFNMKEVHDAATGESVVIQANLNGQTTKPEVDTLLIYPTTDHSPVGHVAAIVEVGDDYVRIADQNHRFHKWEGNYSAQLRLTFVDGKYTIVDKDDDTGADMVPLGWMSFPNTPNRDTSVPVVVHEQFKAKAFDPPSLERVVYHPKNKPPAGWLNIDDPAEKVFIEKFEIDVSGNYEGEPEVTYYLMNIELWFKCARYGYELHKIFAEATEKVLSDDALLAKFELPVELWPRIRRSFVEQRKCLTGRFDFAFNGTDLKIYEYNADSAAVLLESAVVQQKWAKSRGLDELNQRGGGMRMETLLTYAWRELGIPAKSRVHFCIDDDKEELYNGLYCMGVAKKAIDIEGKLCVKFDEFSFNEEGFVVDKDGHRVTHVWKLWNWDTAIQDYLAAKEQRGPSWKPTPQDKVRLCDLILGDESIRVVEPLWKVIPSNKAILPVVYQLHPEHPCILPASFELTEELKQSGYAQKPIVGRVGRNITLVDEDGQTAAASQGNYGNRDMIYQQKFALPNRDGYYGIMGGWIVGEEYGGTGVREDTVTITGGDSPFSCVRIALPFKPEPVTAETVKKD